MRQGEMCLKFVRSGNKVARLLAFRSLLRSNDGTLSEVQIVNTQQWRNTFWSLDRYYATMAEHFLKVTCRVFWPLNELQNEKATLIVVIIVRTESSYLVDPASSHMLVSKIKPCMSKYKQICTVKLRMAH